MYKSDAARLLYLVSRPALYPHISQQNSCEIPAAVIWVFTWRSAARHHRIPADDGKERGC